MASSVFALDGAGKRLWRKNPGAAILSLTAADFAGDGRQVLIAGRENGAIFVLDSAGKCIGCFQAPPRSWPSYRPNSRPVRAARSSRGRWMDR
jgi:hypothetical protein